MAPSVVLQVIFAEAERASLQQQLQSLTEAFGRFADAKWTGTEQKW